MKKINLFITLILILVTTHAFAQKVKTFMASNMTISSFDGNPELYKVKTYNAKFYTFPNYATISNTLMDKDILEKYNYFEIKNALNFPVDQVATESLILPYSKMVSDNGEMQVTFYIDTLELIAGHFGTVNNEGDEVFYPAKRLKVTGRLKLKSSIYKINRTSDVKYDIPLEVYQKEKPEASKEAMSAKAVELLKSDFSTYYKAIENEMYAIAKKYKSDIRVASEITAYDKTKAVYEAYNQLDVDAKTKMRNEINDVFNSYGQNVEKGLIKTTDYSLFISNLNKNIIASIYKNSKYASFQLYKLKEITREDEFLKLGRSAMWCMSSMPISENRTKLPQIDNFRKINNDLLTEFASNSEVKASIEANLAMMDMFQLNFDNAKAMYDKALASNEGLVKKDYALKALNEYLDKKAELSKVSEIKDYTTENTATALSMRPAALAKYNEMMSNKNITLYNGYIITDKDEKIETKIAYPNYHYYKSGFDNILSSTYRLDNVTDNKNIVEYYDAGSKSFKTLMPKGMKEMSIDGKVFNSYCSSALEYNPCAIYTDETPANSALKVYKEVGFGNKVRIVNTKTNEESIFELTEKTDEERNAAEAVQNFEKKGGMLGGMMKLSNKLKDMSDISGKMNNSKMNKAFKPCDTAIKMLDEKNSDLNFEDLKKIVEVFNSNCK